MGAEKNGKGVRLFAWLGNHLSRPRGFGRIVRWFASAGKCSDLPELCLVRDGICGGTAGLMGYELPARRALTLRELRSARVRWLREKKLRGKAMVRKTRTRDGGLKFAFSEGTPRCGKSAFSEFHLVPDSPYVV